MIDKHGFGAAFIMIFNSRDEEITPHKVTQFRYVHSEKADDASIIVIESMDPNLPDHPDLQENKKLKLSWGYTSGKVSGKRSVYIFDVITSFDEQGVRVELKCYDRLAYLKLTSSDKIHTGNIEDIASGIAEANGLDFEGVKDNDQVFHTDINTEKPSILKEDGLTAIATDNTATTLKHYASLPQANKSDYKVMREVLDKEPGGPYILEGRDDELIIRKRNFNQKPIRTYTYKAEPGYLLKFTPETKNKSHRAGATNIQTSGWNPELKSYILGDIGQVHDKDVVLGENLESSYRTFRGDTQNVNNTEDLEVYPMDSGDDEDDLSNVPNIPEDENMESGKTSDGETWKYYDINTEAPAIQKSDGNYTVATDNTAVIINKGLYLKPDLNERHHTVEDNEGDISAEAINRRRELELDKNAATATVLGDPELASGKIIGIFNVSNKFSGNYYITQATHVLSIDGGYVVEMQLVRHGDNGNSRHSKIKSSVFNKPVNNQIGTTQSYEVQEVEVKEIENPE